MTNINDAIKEIIGDGYKYGECVGITITNSGVISAWQFIRPIDGEMLERAGRVTEPKLKAGAMPGVSGIVGERSEEFIPPEQVKELWRRYFDKLAEYNMECEAITREANMT